jgi:hypothetical protein
VPPPSPAKIKVQLLRVTGFSPVILGSATRPYMLAKFGDRVIGRSRVIPSSTTNFDLTAEPMEWSHEVVYYNQEPVRVRVELWDDRGDQSPLRLLVMQREVAHPWNSGEIQFGSALRVVARVTTQRLVLFQPVLARRLGAPGGLSATIRINSALEVRITQIRGLYEPVSAAGRQSRYRAGYISEDDKGRVFINRNLAGAWTKDQQTIELTARVTARAMALPSDVKVKWTLIDPDDPTNDDTHFHQEWGPYVDPNDYNSSGTPTGANDDDNVYGYSSAGPVSRATLYDHSPIWEAVSGFTISDVSDTEAKTTVDIPSHESKVLLHCPKTGGANFIVRAEADTSTSVQKYPAQTGIMTMWKRIDIEVVRMAGAHSLSGALGNIPPFFLPACVQMDFQAERTVAGGLDRAEMAPGLNVLSTRTRAWVDDPGVFTHRGQGGWYFLGAARFPNPLPTGGSPPPIHTGTVYTLGITGGNAWVELPASLTNPDYLEFTWTDSSGRTNEAGFSVHSRTISGGRTRIVLDGNDVNPRFTGHDADGSISHAISSKIFYFPRHQRLASAATLTPGGFNVPTAGATVRVYPPGAVFVTGISPSTPNAATGSGRFFAGRTVLFTYTRKFSTGATPPARRSDFDQQVVSTVVHEFLHAFGMPHKCGYWDWRTPRQHSCCMNYFNTWLINTTNNRLIPGTVGNQDNNMCGRHLMEVRRVHLEDNPGLNW